MKSLKLNWEQIKELYPNDYVGLTEIKRDSNNSIISANVLCSTQETSYEDMLGMAIDNKIYMIYPNADYSNTAGVLT